jgi:glycosyltransferase involved in cell wall biosynthesis
VHVYLTYPFVLSWSLLEAMACGCLVVGSRTPPVEEVIADGQNGLLADFFSPAQIAERVDYALSRQSDLVPLRESARKTVLERFDLKRVCLPAQVALVERLTGTPAARIAA